MKILEHCCYTKYLYEWWQSCRHEGVWHLVNFGDHTIFELINWFNTLCMGTDPTTITVAMPVVTPVTAELLSHLRCGTLNVITQSEFPTTANLGPTELHWVTIPDIHAQIVTVTGSDKYITLSGGLLQAFSPGKYLVNVTTTREAYDSIQPQLNSWLRFYSKR